VTVLAPDVTAKPSYSMRLVRPFLLALRRHPGFPVEILAPLEERDPDDRFPIAPMHELLEGALAITKDPDLGLKAAMEIELGDYGALEYAASSAPSWGAAIEVIGRYMRLINDALDFSRRVEGDRALIQLDSTLVLPRAAADFQSAAFHRATLHRAPADVPRSEIEIWFVHEEPADLTQYARVFPRARVRFGQPFNGFVFPRQLLEQPLPDSDPKLHALIKQHAEQLLAELPKAESLTERVRDLIAQELGGGDPGLAYVARKLHMSPRTLGRKLEQEGTTFKHLLDEMRRRMALRYVGGHDLGLAEVAFLLGFSQAAAFHRAFKRWTGQTPLEYRRTRRG
jgi:AraC-like DNA-binding protein